jgi:hypothetical protein
MPTKRIYHAVVYWLLIHQSLLKYLSVIRIGDNWEYRLFLEGSLFLAYMQKVGVDNKGGRSPIIS